MHSGRGRRGMHMGGHGCILAGRRRPRRRRHEWEGARSLAQFAEVNWFVARSERVRSLDELGPIMEEVTRVMGFDYYALVQHIDIRKSSTADSLWLHNYPERWAQAFTQRGLYATDPMHLASQKTCVGFVWSEVGKIIRLTAHQRRVLAEAEQEGLGDGFTVPAHLPGDSNGSCSFGMRAGRGVPRDKLMTAQLIGTYAFETGRKLLASRRGTQAPPRLTPRQLECVTFAARGKTDGEIAAILGIKESTVRDYIEQACLRYDVRRRVQLIVRAIHDGQLTLRDALG